MIPLRQRMIEDMRVRNLSPHTLDSYLQQVSQFPRHFRRSPEALGPEVIRSYQVFPVNERKLAASSICTAVSALRFLYKVTLKRDWTFDDVIPAPKKPHKLPVVLSLIHRNKPIALFLSGRLREDSNGLRCCQLPVASSIAAVPENWFIMQPAERTLVLHPIYGR